jgi:hypothetical protein
VSDDYTQVFQLVSLREARSQREQRVSGGASVSSAGDPSPRPPASVGAKASPSDRKRKTGGSGNDQIMKRIEDDRERVSFNF